MKVFLPFCWHDVLYMKESGSRIDRRKIAKRTIAFTLTWTKQFCSLWNKQTESCSPTQSICSLAHLTDRAQEKSLLIYDWKPAPWQVQPFSSSFQDCQFTYVKRPESCSLNWPNRPVAHPSRFSLDISVISLSLIDHLRSNHVV